MVLAAHMSKQALLMLAASEGSVYMLLGGLMTCLWTSSVKTQEERDMTLRPWEAFALPAHSNITRWPHFVPCHPPSCLLSVGHVRLLRCCAVESSAAWLLVHSGREAKVRTTNARAGQAARCAEDAAKAPFLQLDQTQLVSLVVPAASRLDCAANTITTCCSFEGPFILTAPCCGWPEAQTRPELHDAHQCHCTLPYCKHIFWRLSRSA